MIALFILYALGVVHVIAQYHENGEDAAHWETWAAAFAWPIVAFGVVVDYGWRKYREKR